MKLKQRETLEMIKKSNGKCTTGFFNTEGWIGNPFDSISTLFDTLAEASLTQDSRPLESYYGMFLNEFNNYAIPNQPSSLPLEVAIPVFADYQETIYGNSNTISSQNSRSNQSTQRPKPKYYPRIVQGSSNKNETYISLALEAALIGLGQQRLMPNGEYLQEKSLKQEERLLTKLNDIDFDHKLINVLREQVIILYESGPYSGLGLGQ